MTTVSKYLFSFFLIFTLSFLHGTPSHGQAKIAPIALYMSDDDQTGRFVVRNAGNGPVEVQVDLLYGYPTTDSTGNVYLKTFDKAPDGEPSAMAWVRTYPRHTTLPPNEQQTVRIAARPPSGLPDGEYWVRPAVSVRKVNNQIPVRDDDQNVEANLTVTQRTILSLNYRHGNVRTGIDIEKLSASQRNDTLYINIALDRTGNAAYLGHLSLSLLNSAGNRELHHLEEIAVYHTQERKFAFKTRGIAPGTYQVKLSLDTRKRHQENKAILDTTPASQTTRVTIK